MNKLEQFVPKSHDVGHFARGVVDQDPTMFFDQGGRTLRSVHQEVIERDVAKLEEMEGRWHPLGFMVYHLGVNPTSGESLRLHIWPSGERALGDRQPNMHNHGWHLISLVLAGRYEDQLLKVVPGQDVSGDQYALRPYNLTYHRNGLDSFDTDGSTCEVLIDKSRRIDAGKLHTIPAGVFHLPTIPSEHLTATLVLDSPAFDFETTVILMGGRESFVAERREIKPDEALRAKEQLIAELL